MRRRIDLADLLLLMEWNYRQRYLWSLEDQLLEVRSRLALLDKMEKTLPDLIDNIKRLEELKVR